MAQETFEVTSYTYYNWSSRNSGKTNLMLYGATKTCAVWFVEDPDANLPEAKQNGANFYSLYYHHWQLPHLLDMVRNEKPVFVYYNDNNGANNSRISTASEPVGEGEQ
jgi:hypothetical protein